MICGAGLRGPKSSGTPLQPQDNHDYQACALCGLSIAIAKRLRRKTPSYATFQIGISGRLKSFPLASVFRGQAGTSAVRCCSPVKTVRFPTSQLIPLSVQVASRGSSQCLHQNFPQVEYVSCISCTDRNFMLLTMADMLCERARVDQIFSDSALSQYVYVKRHDNRFCVSRFLR